MNVFLDYVVAFLPLQIQWLYHHEYLLGLCSGVIFHTSCNGYTAMTQCPEVHVWKWGESCQSLARLKWIVPLQFLRNGPVGIYTRYLPPVITARCVVRFKISFTATWLVQVAPVRHLLALYRLFRTVVHFFQIAWKVLRSIYVFNTI
jgi:hypothetical protein